MSISPFSFSFSFSSPGSISGMCYFYFPSIFFLLLFPSRHCHCMGKEIIETRKRGFRLLFPFAYITHLDCDKDIATAFYILIERDDIDIHDSDCVAACRLFLS